MTHRADPSSPSPEVVTFPPDAGLVTVLDAFTVRPGALLGHGGEAWVYALDHDRVLRVLHDDGDPALVDHEQGRASRQGLRCRKRRTAVAVGSGPGSGTVRWRST